MHRMIYFVASILICKAEIVQKNYNTRLKKSIADQDATDTNFINYPTDGFPQESYQGSQDQGDNYQNPIEDQFPLLPDYEFGYSVNDEATGDQKSHQEFRRDNIVHGSYFLIEPDGSKRTVFYTAGVHGFNAYIQRDPPQNEVYYDQDNQATSDGIRDVPNGNFVDNTQGKAEATPDYHQNLIEPIIVEDAPLRVSVNSAPNPEASEEIDRNLIENVPLQVSTENPAVVTEVPEISMSSPKPFEPHQVTNIENPNAKVATTNPDPDSKPITYGEFPLLAHILPSYAKRYALNYS